MSNPDADPNLLAWVALSRVNDGGVTRLGDDYLDHGSPTPDYLAGAFAELFDTGSLAVADPDLGAPRRVTITAAGYLRYAQLRGTAAGSGSVVR
jgi:hypothetical protein